MSDDEIVAFCNIGNESAEFIAKYLASLTPEKRETLDKMKQIEMWDASDGLIPLPEGVIVCRSTRHD